MTLKNLKKIINNIPEEYNDCEVFRLISEEFNECEKVKNVSHEHIISFDSKGFIKKLYHMDDDDFDDFDENENSERIILFK